ncbi:type II toxin-antitoxin system Phd/YefM family antitoxin [Pseudomonas sp. BN414]|uniref:type II toxin-antitoxin system Phd/YefM family antitoxin n=1 Tax=Pseudomonas sp. BN414 TaxID=2567888 RepID=UPI0024570E1D|nr:type II toxin-antitoxin system Phd/YefM family antitoxin [Pseudomonas sp. BN414]MDH4569989.1 type II toxin-antitoxin system Phd/YefM family antitoxin [Pseudomonas sp. BN414]
MRIQTISYLKQHAATLDLDEPLCITQNGLPTMVVQSYEQYQQTHEAIALVKLLSMGDKDIESGRLCSSDELLQKLASRTPRTNNSGL